MSSGAGPSIVVAGGGTAGHIEPALAVADALRRLDPSVRVTALGTERGLEGRLVPARGYDLRMIPPVPLPRKPTLDLLRLPARVIRSVRATRAILDDVGADVVVGFGGYVSLPAYVAAARPRRRVPVVVHEANARAGIANKVGVRLGGRALAAVPGSGLDAEVVGIPVRESVVSLDREGLRARAREHFGLDPGAPTILVVGGSQGAVRLNTAFEAAARDISRAGIGVLHAVGPKNTIAVEPVPGAPAYVTVPYLTAMDLAYAAADLVVCRAGAMTVAEVSSVGLPAVYVPLPHGNGEQALNASPVVAAGGGLIVDDADFDADRIRAAVIPLVSDPGRLRSMGESARAAGHAEAAEVIAGIVLDAARGGTTRRRGKQGK